jgi:hypothetical protein
LVNTFERYDERPARSGSERSKAAKQKDRPKAVLPNL